MMNVSYVSLLSEQLGWDNATTSNITAAVSKRRYKGALEIGLVGSGVALGIASIVMNVMFLIATRFVKDKHTAYHRFIKNLAVADVLAACSFLLISSIPSWGLIIFHNKERQQLLPLFMYVVRGLPWMFFTGYLLTLTGLTVNQYLGVCKPWSYASLVTTRKVTICLILIWLIGTFQMIIPFTLCLNIWGRNEYSAFRTQLHIISDIEMQVWMSLFMLSLVFNIALNIVIYLKIRKIKMERKLSSNQNPDSLNVRMKQEAFITILVLLCASVFFRLPFPLIGMIGIQVKSGIVDASIILLLYLNFFIDPIIFITRMHEVRRTWRNLLGACAMKLGIQCSDDKHSRKSPPEEATMVKLCEEEDGEEQDL